MAYVELILHWMGKTPEEITAHWRPPADPAILPAKVAHQRRKLADKVVAGVKKRANAGDLAALEWLAGQRLIDLSQPSVEVVDGIIQAATGGDVAAAEWLRSKGLLVLDMPPAEK